MPGLSCALPSRPSWSNAVAFVLSSQCKIHFVRSIQTSSPPSQESSEMLRKPTISGAASREAWPAGWGMGFCPFTPLSWDPTWSPASSSGAPNIRRTWMCWSGSRGTPRRWSESWSTSPTRTGWGSWGCSAWRREGSGVTLEQLPVPEGADRKGGGGFSQGGVVIRQGGMALN